MTMRIPALALFALLFTLLPACGSTGGGGSSPWMILRDGESIASEPGAAVDWSLDVSGSDVTLVIDGRTLVMGGAASNHKLRYVLKPGDLDLRLDILAKPSITVGPDSLRIGTKTHALPAFGRYNVDLDSASPFGR